MNEVLFSRKFRYVLTIKNWICKENQICFYVKERVRFLLKSIRSVLCKVKKKVILSGKIISVFFYVKEINKKDFLKEDPLL